MQLPPKPQLPSGRSGAERMLWSLSATGWGVGGGSGGPLLNSVNQLLNVGCSW